MRRRGIRTTPRYQRISQIRHDLAHRPGYHFPSENRSARPMSVKQRVYAYLKQKGILKDGAAAADARRDIAP